MNPKLERVGPRHPECCQATLGTGRCHYKAAPGAQYCFLHGGGASAGKAKRQELKNYLIQSEHGRRAGELANSGALKDLTDEVALVRLALEGIIKTVKSNNDLLLYSDKISSLSRTIQGLVETVQKMQEKNKELIDRTTLLGITDGILNVILKYVEDPDNQRLIGEEIYECIIKGMGGEVS